MKASLAKKALLGIIVIFLPIFITFLLVYNQNRVYLRNRILDTLTIIAESYERQVDQFLEMNKRRARDFASDGFIRNQLLGKTWGRKPASNFLSEHLVKNKLPLDKSINTIHVISLEGKIIASTNTPDIGRDLSQESFFIKGQGSVTIEEYHIGDKEIPQFAISSPIFSKNTGKLIGVIINLIQITELNKLLLGEYSMDPGVISRSKGKGMWKTLEIYLVNRDKRMLTKSVFVEGAMLKQVVDTQPVNICLTKGEYLCGFYKDYRGEEVIGASVYIPSMGWVLLVEINKGEVIAPIRNILTGAFITGTVVIVMIILLFIAFIKKVAQPLRMISDAADGIAMGDFDITLSVKTHDEIGILCNSFNYMIQQIKVRTTKLMESENRLAEAQRIAHVGNWEWDAVTHKAYWSDELYRIFGLPPKEIEITYEKFLSYIHPDDVELVKKSVHDALSGKKPYDIDFRIFLENGAVRCIHENAEVVYDNAGRVVKIVGTTQDVTENMQIKEALAEQSRLATLDAEVNFALIQSGALREILQRCAEALACNLDIAFARIWTLDEEKNMLELQGSAGMYTHIDGAHSRIPVGMFNIGLIAKERKPYLTNAVIGDPRVHDQEWAEREGIIAFAGYPIFIEGRVVGVVAIFAKKTLSGDVLKILRAVSDMIALGIERKRSEEFLKKSEASLAEAQRIAHIGNWDWDIAKNELWWSDEIYRTFGINSQEFGATYEAFLEYVYPDDREFVKKSVLDALCKKKPYDIGHRILLKDKTLRFVHGRAEVTFNEAGNAIRMIGTVQDTTEQKRAEEESNLLQSIIIEIAKAEDFYSALGIVLRKVCESTGWVYGEVWYPCQDCRHLESILSWHSGSEKLDDFGRKSRKFTFPPGAGIPGRVWLSKKPEWKRDVTVDRYFPRASIAKEYGLKAAMGIPVIANDKVIAVLNFFVQEQRDEDERLIKLVSSVATQLGIVIQRKDIENALRKSEEKLQSILDNTTAVIYVKDIYYRYTFINRQWEKLFHSKKDEVKGKTDYDLWAKEIADGFRANDKRVIEAKTPLKFEEIASHDDGLHTYISIKFPLFDSTGNIYAICSISTDITERKRMEDQLRKLSYAVEQSPNIIIITDTSGCIQYVNSKFTQLTGYTGEEVIGKDPRILKSGETPHEEYKRLWNLISSGGEWRGEMVNKKKSGELYWEVARISPIIDENGAITHFVKIAEDVTEIKRIENEKIKLREQLYHAQRLESIGKLAGGVAHDFNNILTAIISYGNLLQMEMEEGNFSKDYLQKILTSAEKAAHLIQGLLAFSRKQIGNPKPIKLNETVKSIENLLIRLIREDIKLKLDFFEKECIVFADSTQIEQVLMNLVANARDAMPDGGLVTISTQVVEMDSEFVRVNGYGEIGLSVLISVSDTGIGMDEETKKMIFEPFFTTKEVGKGTGLGLSIVYGIVKQHKGYIDVSSEIGKGTTFWIYLPIRDFYL